MQRRAAGADLIARVLIGPGSLVAMGLVTRRGLLFGTHGAGDWRTGGREGIVMDQIPRGTRLIYVTPRTSSRWACR